MELEGFGASLFGKSIYVICDPIDAWIPWEFIASDSYACKILISGNGSDVRCLEAANEWTAIFKPQTIKDWSIIATIIKGVGHNILLVVDPFAPVIPPNFISYIDTLMNEGYITLTKIVIGKHSEILFIPDAIFFPVLKTSDAANTTYDIMAKLPGRNGHGGFTSMTHTDWHTLVNVTVESNLGLVISDVNEKSWELFWHKIADSYIINSAHLMRNGIAWMKTGISLIEYCTEKH